MNNISIVSLRLGKTSVEAIKDLYQIKAGLTEPLNISVTCTQVPQELEIGMYVFIWLGSDNSKGIPTLWKQGYKAFGRVVSIRRGASYNDESTTEVEILYAFGESVNRLDFLKYAPEAYYDCSALPIIGLDDHSNQTIRLLQDNGERFDIGAMFYALNTIDKTLKPSLLTIDEGFQAYFGYLPPSKINSSCNVSLVSFQESKCLPYLTAIRTKPFLLLAGISGTGKSRIVRKLAQATDDIDVFEREEDRWECHKPANFELIQVKPNWHNSMDVVGYKSNIGVEHYEFTPFVEFVAKAWLHPETPFFLCLDEMNLAPVEEYFAEYLSAIESRTFENGVYETDPIIKPFDDFGVALSTKMISHLLGAKADDTLETRFRKKGLTLPKNLIVMGTVNMDDTTFSFSRKVLDRAMSIEMNEVDYSAFLDGTSENDVPVLVEDNALLIDRPIKGQTVKDEIEAEKVIEYLTDVNLVLDGTPFKLGYRAANEAILFVAAAKAWGNDNLADALDQFTLMKILSRIEGDESKLMKDADKTVLECLSEVINKHLKASVLDEEIPTEETARPAKLKSIKKVEEMKAVLERDHFVSYWS